MTMNTQSRDLPVGSGSSPFPSLHASEVRNPKELKICEYCGGLFLRPIGLSAVSNPMKYCNKCEEIVYANPCRHTASQSSQTIHLQPSSTLWPSPVDSTKRRLSQKAHVEDGRLHPGDGVRRSGNSKKLFSADEKVAMVEKADKLALRLRVAQGTAGHRRDSSHVRQAPDVLSVRLSKANRADKVDRVDRKRREETKVAAYASEVSCERKHPYTTRKLAEQVLKRMRHGKHQQGMTVYACSCRKYFPGPHFHLAGAKRKA